MPTLNEFIEKTLIENNLSFNAADIEKFVVSEAKKRAKNNVANISYEEVRQMVIEYKVDTKATKKKEDVAEQGKEKECQENQTPYQTPLF